MSNVFWYICIAAIGTGIIIFTMYRKRNIIDLLSFFLSATALGYICEIVVLFIFNSYAYKPGLFKDYIAEDLFGHILCNGFYWGGFAIFVAAFSLNASWILLISVFFMLTEVLFLKLGIYVHHWWRLYMTGVGAFIFFSIIKIWYLLLMEKQYKLLRYITFYLISWVLLEGPHIVLLLLGKEQYHIGWVQNMYHDDTLFSATYSLGLSYVCVFFICILQKWFWKVTPLFINLFINIILINTNVLTFQDNWNLFYMTLVHSLFLAVFIILERHSLKIDNNVI